MSHRLLEYYPSIYHICSFDFNTFQETLSEHTAEDISSLKIRDLLERINNTYLSLTDAAIITAKSVSTCLCHISLARFVSFPSGFSDKSGQMLQIYLTRTKNALASGNSFQVYGFGNDIIPSVKTPPRMHLQRIASLRSIPANAIPSRHLQNLDMLCHDAQKLLTNAQLLLHEIDEYHKGFLQPPSPDEKRSLIERIRQRIRSIFGRQ